MGTVDMIKKIEVSNVDAQYSKKIAEELSRYEDMLVALCEEQRRQGYIARRTLRKINKMLPECRRLPWVR
ncbi:MAG: hypothetical protein BMS9Abin11_1583 [Gammaproteobacteria bacterium]|nr:MAG: hypothetical protein BMS9Abin11_1583 [Gammaproteobacteria bacterium]